MDGLGLGRGIAMASGRKTTPETTEKVQCTEKVTMDRWTGCLCQYLLTNAPPRKKAGGNIFTWTSGIVYGQRASVRVK